MRLPFERVYRAFPELDRFDDARCERFVGWAVDHAGWWRWVVRGMMISLPGAGLAAVRATGLYQVLDPLVAGDLAQQTLRAVCTGVLGGGVPLAGAFVLRDLWLRRRVRAVLSSTACLRCRYQLLGLSAVELRVTCPECGLVRELDADSAAAAAMLRAGEAQPSKPSEAQ
jgi:hypothetical protein